MTLHWLAKATVPKGAEGMCPTAAFAADTPIGRVYVLGAPGSDDLGWYVWGPSGWWTTPVRGYLRSFWSTEAAFRAVERETRAVTAGGTS